MNCFDLTSFGFGGRPRGRAAEVSTGALDLEAAFRLGGIVDKADVKCTSCSDRWLDVVG